MMRVHCVSDLHADIEGNSLASMPSVDADVTVVAGDAHAPGTLALRLVRDLYPDRSRPLIYVPGNHDYYSHHDKNRPELKTTLANERMLMSEVAHDLGISLLDDGAVEIDGVLFVGATLWTDMSMRPTYMTHADAARAAARSMNDFRLIKVGAGRSRDKLTVGQTIDAHKSSVSYITKKLAERPEGMDAVVITHHAPSRRSLLGWDPDCPRLDDLDWCYASDLEHLMTGDRAPALWLHGHIHCNQDYFVGNTRVVSNPRGYPKFGGGRENPGFDPGLVVALEPKPTVGMRM